MPGDQGEALRSRPARADAPGRSDGRHHGAPSAGSALVTTPRATACIGGCALAARPALRSLSRRRRHPPPHDSGEPREQPRGHGAAGANCAHPEADWTASGGMRTCTRCGTRRVVDYRALALALELPERGPCGQPDGPTVAGSGTGAVG
ncbi:DUF6255 family natural product biosynthesis protein [Streptomyces triculaminicus]|uniref:DUF6255 family natural product biosynthesis protein n=1 Tax=Streptomyces triculaminicus TaxID=2816232 RepID=UPI0037D3DE47